MKFWRNDLQFQLLCVTLFAMLATMPILSEKMGFNAVPYGLTLILILVYRAGRTRGKWFFNTFVFAVLVLLWKGALAPKSPGLGVEYFAMSCLFFFSVFLTLRFVYQSEVVDRETLAASASAYLLLGLACGALYAALNTWWPGGIIFSSIERPLNLNDYIYFSFVVLTTIGFGDAVPKDSLNRSVAMVESIIGLFYIVMVVSRLVSLYRDEKDEFLQKQQKLK